MLIEIIGKTATSGALMVSSKRQGLLPFRVGCGTTTVLANVPAVGPLVELRVTLDGSGLFPGWHLKCALSMWSSPLFCYCGPGASCVAIKPGCLAA